MLNAHFAFYKKYSKNTVMRMEFKNLNKYKMLAYNLSEWAWRPSRSIYSLEFLGYFYRSEKKRAYQ